MTPIIYPAPLTVSAPNPIILVAVLVGVALLIRGLA